MNIGVAIVSTKKSKLASFSRSVLIFGASPARFVALMNIENPCYSRPSSKTKGGGLGPPPKKQTCRLQAAARSSVFSQRGNHFPFQSLGELGNAALPMHGDFACKHVNLLCTGPLRAAIANHPVFRWFAPLHPFPYLRCAHHTGQGLILRRCS